MHTEEYNVFELYPTEIVGTICTKDDITPVRQFTYP